jgi:hypothetical protein
VGAISVEALNLKRSVKLDRAIGSSIGEPAGSNESALAPSNEPFICPVCGAEAVEEKCKIICRSEICRGRVIFTCSEF